MPTSESTTHLPSVPEFYSGKNVFITGATGFLGKVTIEKLLRSCPEVKGVYCLIRPKKGQLGEERLKDLCQTKLFDKLREKQPDFEKKIHAVHGDVLEDGLGLSEEVRKSLEKEINVIIHSAATVKFDEHIRLSVELNVIAVRRMVKFAKLLENLDVFVHISTAYANCENERIDEFVYSPPVEPQKIIDILSWMDDDTLTLLTPRLLGNKPNTYTLTKHLGEVLLVEEGSGLNLTIIRPSIITATWKEPVRGWIDNFNGPSGLCIATGKGMLKSMLGCDKNVADLIPVDLNANLIIAAAWHTALTKPSQPVIYHMTSGGSNPITWGQMSNHINGFYMKIPLDKCFRRPNVVLTPNSLLHEYWLFASHMVPAYIYDVAASLVGGTPRMVKIYGKLHKKMKVLEYFVLNEWEWNHSNTDALGGALSPEDQETFYFDASIIHWPTYTENYCLGTKMYVLKEDLTSLPAARAHIKRLRNIRYLFNTFLLVMFWRVLVARSSLARNLWTFIMSFMSKFLRFFRLTASHAMAKPFSLYSTK